MYAELRLNAAEHGFTLIRHCAWLGTKLAFYALVGVVVSLWIFLTGFIIFKCIHLGVSPIAVIGAFDNHPMSSLFNLLLGPLWSIAIGTVVCGTIGAGIGAIAAIVQRARS